MLHKLSLEREPSGKADRGHITTILEQDEYRADSMDSQTTDASFSDRAQPTPCAAGEAAYGSPDSLTGPHRLPKVRVTRNTVDTASQVAIAGNRQNSLPDLTARRAPRHRNMSRKDSDAPPPRSVPSQVLGFLLLLLLLLLLLRLLLLPLLLMLVTRHVSNYRITLLLLLSLLLITLDCFTKSAASSVSHRAVVRPGFSTT